MVEHWARHLFEQTNKGFISVYMVHHVSMFSIGPPSCRLVFPWTYDNRWIWIGQTSMPINFQMSRTQLVSTGSWYRPTLGQGLDPGMSSISEIFPFDGWKKYSCCQSEGRNANVVKTSYSILHCRSPIFVDQFNSNQLVSWNLATQGSACVMALGSGTIHFWETFFQIFWHIPNWYPNPNWPDNLIDLQKSIHSNHQ